MKKIIINENWEQEEIEILDILFVIIYSKSSTEKYVVDFGVDDKKLLSIFTSFTNELNERNVTEQEKVYLIALPNTSQVRALLNVAKYNGITITEAMVEATNNLLLNPELEEIEYWRGLSELTEAKKKKKKKKKRKTPRVTYTTGWPWYNDHMFNHHNGTCDCNKDKDEAGEDAADNANDAIGGGESVGDAGSTGGESSGDFGGGDAGGMGESLVTEAMTPYEKMQALDNGTRGFNAAAASDQKLWDNFSICRSNGFWNALDIIKAEMVRRGLISSTPAKNEPIIKLDLMDFHPADLSFIKDNLNSKDILLSNIKSANNEIKQAIITLIFALTAGYTEIALEVKTYILTEITKQDLKQIITDCKSNSKLIDRITSIYNDTMNEGVTKMNTLNESKRYIKRYYIRPQNIFCSNKAEILNALVKEVGENNCSVYSLKALDDHDDVHLLQPKDIIYYYDDGILYDKNHVKVMDYDLNVKHEEERKKFGNVDAISDETFDAEYEDRLTEAFDSINEFTLDFTDVNAYGETLKEGVANEFVCCICGEEYEGYGNNPAPIKENGKCCDACNRKFVIPARLNIEIED